MSLKRSSVVLSSGLTFGLAGFVSVAPILSRKPLSAAGGVLSFAGVVLVGVATGVGVVLVGSGVSVRTSFSAGRASGLVAAESLPRRYGPTVQPTSTRIVTMVDWIMALVRPRVASTPRTFSGSLHLIFCRKSRTSSDEVQVELRPVATGSEWLLERFMGGGPFGVRRREWIHGKSPQTGVQPLPRILRTAIVQDRDS